MNIRMHIYVMKIDTDFDADDDDRIDHINNNRLDNRKINLRKTNSSGNNNNRTKNTKSTSKYQGVNFFQRDLTWMAQITKDHKYHFLGYYITEIEAAIAYNLKATELYGDNANLNIFEKDVENLTEKVIKQITNNKKRAGKSKYRGVSKGVSSWQARISKDKIEYRLGSFNTELRAAQAYNEKAKENWKNLNKI
jgi:hypothetical protein